MCRNCFSAYGRYHDLQTTLLAGLKNSLYAVESSIGEGIVPLRSTLSQRKRPHGESSSPTSSKRLHRGSVTAIVQLKDLQLKDHQVNGKLTVTTLQFNFFFQVIKFSVVIEYDFKFYYR